MTYLTNYLWLFTFQELPDCWKPVYYYVDQVIFIYLYIYLHIYCLYVCMHVHACMHPEINLKCCPQDPSLFLEIIFLGLGAHCDHRLSGLWILATCHLHHPSSGITSAQRYDRLFLHGASDWIKILWLYWKYFSMLQMELSLYSVGNALLFDSTNTWASRSKNFNMLYLGLVT